MELEHSFTVPVPKSRAWDVLLDVERVASCMPGATLDSVDGDEIHGKIKVKVGPISMMYAGTARFVERDEAAGVVVLEASGKETKGAGTASASVRSVLEDRGDETHVLVQTTLNVTGKPAQFGRGVMTEVSGKLLGIFAANLAATLAEPEVPTAASTGAASTAGDGTTTGAAAEPAEASTTAASTTAASTTAAGAGTAVTPPAAAAAATSIDELKLPARAAAGLRREGIETLSQLSARTDDELLAIDGIGPASIIDIKDKLTERGLPLGQPVAVPSPAAATEPAGASAAQVTATVEPTQGEPTPGAPTPGAPQPRVAAHQPEDDALNLLKVAGLPVLKRAIPVLVGLTAALLIGLRHRMRHRAR